MLTHLHARPHACLPTCTYAASMHTRMHAQKGARTDALAHSQTHRRMRRRTQGAYTNIQAPYLQLPRAPIPVDHNHELFNDDFLIASSSSIERTRHRFVANHTPLRFLGDTPLPHFLESTACDGRPRCPTSDTQFAFGWILAIMEFDLKHRFLAWRLCNVRPSALFDNHTSYVCIYSSEDSQTWNPIPVDNVVPGTNAVLAMDTLPNHPSIVKGPGGLYLLWPQPGFVLESAPLYKSTDNGFSWHFVMMHEGCRDECMHACKHARTCAQARAPREVSLQTHANRRATYRLYVVQSVQKPLGLLFPREHAVF